MGSQRFVRRLGTVGGGSLLVFLLLLSSCGQAPEVPIRGTTREPVSSMATAGCGAMNLGLGADFNGLVPFPADNVWNQDISTAPVDPDSSAIISYISASAPLHPDFDSKNGGIPYIVVDSSTTRLVNVHITDPSESDVMPMPFPLNAPIEAGTDHHILVVDKDGCWLYEVWEGSRAGGEWIANNNAVWDLQNYNHRPYTWTSADAAGLPILPGLVRFDEVANGEIHHALRFTVPRTTAALISPATHWAQTNRGSPIPMGMRLRLKANFDISGFSGANQVILTALKKYGMIVADNGTEMYLSGAPDPRWSNYDLRKLKRAKASDFEVIKMAEKITQDNVPVGPAPGINSFTASPGRASAGMPVALKWQAHDASYYYINPRVGVVRGDMVVVNPEASTKYTLTATGPFGRATATVTVEVR